MKNLKKKLLVSALCVLPIITSGCEFNINGNVTNDNDDKTDNSNVINENQNTDNNFVSKLDDSKDFVYDAEYTKNVSADSYLMDKTYYAKDIVVPYINVNSNYASKSNSEIKKVFDEAINTYNEGVSSKMVYIDECNYKKYIDNDVASVILTYTTGGTDLPVSHYYTYNVNLKDGNELSYEDTYKSVGLSSSSIESKVEEAITNAMKEKLSNFTTDNYPEGTNFDTYNDKSIENYKKSVQDNTLKYYVSEDEKLNIIVTLSIPAGRFEFDTIITID